MFGFLLLLAAAFAPEDNSCGGNGNNNGEELSRRAGSLSSCNCAAMCNDNVECAAWTYIPINTMIDWNMGTTDCVLRKEDGGLNDNCGGNCISGVSTPKRIGRCEQQQEDLPPIIPEGFSQDNQFASGGGNIAYNERTTQEECEQLCRNEYWCSFYSWKTGAIQSNGKAWCYISAICDLNENSENGFDNDSEEYTTYIVERDESDGSGSVYYDNSGSDFRSDLFDRYDENLDEELTLNDLLDMGLHMHIYDEILKGTGDNTLDIGDVESHTQSYDAIWESIVQTIKDLDYQREGGEAGVVNINDMELIKAELQEATDNFNDWTTGYQKAANSLNNEFGTNETLSITFEQLDEHANNATSKFHERIHGAFERLGGSTSSSISSERLQRNKEGIALLLAAFEDLHNKGNDKVDKTTYMKQLDLIEGIVNDEELFHENALAKINSGRNMNKQDLEL